MKISHAKSPRNETKRRSFPGKQKDRAEETADERGNKPTNTGMKNKQAREEEKRRIKKSTTSQTLVRVKYIYMFKT